MPSDNPKYFKVLLLGESGAGKSALGHALVGDSFIDARPRTVGVECFVRKNQDQSLQLTVWDPSGDDRYREIANGYYRDPDILIYCFDSSSSFEQSLLSFKTTFQTIIKTNFESEPIDCLEQQPPRAPIELFFVATKVTDETQKNIPTSEQLQRLVRDFDAKINSNLNCIPTNAESGVGIQHRRGEISPSLESLLFESAQRIPKAVLNEKQAEVQNEPEPHSQPTNACFKLSVLFAIAAVGSVAAVVALVILTAPVSLIMIPVATAIVSSAVAGLFFFASRNSSGDALTDEKAPNDRP